MFSCSSNFPTKINTMLGLLSPSHPQFLIPIPHQTIRKSFRFHPLQTQISTILSPKLHINPRKILQWRPKASENGGGGGVEKGLENGDGGEDGEGKKGDDDDGGGGRPKFNLKWLDLIADRDPDNIVAVALTGVIAWASLRVLGQLFFISAAILVAAIKYSFIAALLIFILITLL